MASVATVIAQDQGIWHSSQIKLDDLCSQREQRRGCFIVFLPPEADRDKLQKAFGMPVCTWSRQYVQSTGFFSAQETQESSPAYSTAFRFLVKMTHSDVPRSGRLTNTVHYDWVELGYWTQWRPGHSSVLLCSIKEAGNSCSSSVQQDTIEWLGSANVTLSNFPFAWHALLLEKVITPLFDRSVWKCRDLIRAWESDRPKIEDHQENYKLLHEIARHAFHSTETLHMAIEVVRSMLKDLDTFWEDHKPTLMPIPAKGQTMLDDEPRLVDCRAVSRSLCCQMTLLDSFHGRSQAIANRVGEEINLAFHVSTQRDSKTASQIAESSLADSAATKTISILGMIFLPGTLISGIFGMNFFTYSPTESGPGLWTVSSKFWIYWATTIPVTLVIVSVWMISQSWGGRTRDQPKSRRC